MGGMCLGSLLLPRYVSARPASAARLRVSRARHRPSSACFVLFGMPLVGGVYTAWAGDGVSRILLRGDRGGDLPAAADVADGCDAAGDRALGRDDAARRVVARLLLRRATSPARCSAASSPASTCCACYDMAIATYVAVAINVAVAAIGLMLVARRRRQVAVESARRRSPPGRGRAAGLRGDRALRHDRARGARSSGRACSRCCSARRSTRSR